MLSNGTYDHLKILCDLSRISWFIKECAMPEAVKNKHAEHIKIYQALEKDLLKHIQEFKKNIKLDE